MTSNLEQAIERFDKEFCKPNPITGELQVYEKDSTFYVFERQPFIDFLSTEIPKAFALGTLNGLDKAIELLPEEKTEKLRSGKQDDLFTGFNACRSQILSKIKEVKEKLK